MLPDAPTAPAPPPSLERYRALLENAMPMVVEGRVREVVGLLAEVDGIPGRLGEMCRIERAHGGTDIEAEVVGFKGDRTLVMPLGDLHGVQAGARVVARGGLLTVPVGPEVLGRVLDGLGRPIDGRGPILASHRQPRAGGSPHVLERSTITQPLSTGIRAIDGLLTCGLGQRMGIFAGSGVGKSTVLAMIARGASTDVNVIALIGERGREVREFIEESLGPEGLARSVVVVSTSDEPAPLRLNAAWVATTIAEEFRAQGLNVTLMMDSVTRFAMAQREIGLALGEPPAMKGYTPSVFANLARLLERAGTGTEGTITAFYTVLVESDDLTEPVTDTVRGTLDGHIVLSRELAAENHYPAIDVLQSVSRVMSSITTREHRDAAGRMREFLARYRRSRDLVSIGAYQRGADPALDEALAHLPAIDAFLRQRPDQAQPLTQTIADLERAVSPGDARAAVPTQQMQQPAQQQVQQVQAPAVLEGEVQQ
ncbi:MAG: FliI/YscN family ATPase [Dehalococcoidia bacterium]|nr:FliI/YscN family ATPase [Dehalococcoidia bacterium]MCB9492307.1 FliI/YscN family ATPase [Dehalococcoidia bacterium]